MGSRRPVAKGEGKVDSRSRDAGSFLGESGEDRVKQTLFLNGFPPFEVERERSWQADDPSAWNYSHSLALICPKCLSQWAILAFEGDEVIHPQGAFCQQHGDGRIFLRLGAIDQPLLSVLPEALLRREFHLTMKELGI